MDTVAAEEEVKTSNKEFKQVTFERLSADGFQRDVYKRVDDYFKINNLSKNMNTEMVIKAIVFIVGWVGTYFLLMSNVLSPWVMLVVVMIHGFLTAMVGVNIGHDAIHGALSKNSKINKFFGLLFNFIGANDYTWSIMHNIVHHTYTNIPEYDGDIEQVPILRIEPTQKLMSIHRYQHIYAFFLYCLGTLSWVFIKDYKKFFQHQLGGHYRKTFPKKEIYRLFIYKALYYSVFIVAPYLVIDLPWYYILFGFLMGHFVEGLTLALLFMLAHITEGIEFPIPNKDGEIDMPWADFQMHTTSDFGINSWATNFFSGGLNLQVEHHLFPQICHTHYRKIAKIVKQTAKDHDVPYIEHTSFLSAINSHVRMLKKFGTSE